RRLAHAGESGDENRGGCGAGAGEQVNGPVVLLVPTDEVREVGRQLTGYRRAPGSTVASGQRQLPPQDRRLEAAQVGRVETARAEQADALTAARRRFVGPPGDVQRAGERRAHRLALRVLL